MFCNKRFHHISGSEARATEKGTSSKKRIWTATCSNLIIRLSCVERANLKGAEKKTDSKHFGAISFCRDAILTDRH